MAMYTSKSISMNAILTVGRHECGGFLLSFLSLYVHASVLFSEYSSWCSGVTALQVQICVLKEIRCV